MQIDIEKLEFYISDEKVPVLRRGYEVLDELDERSTAEFIVIDKPGTMSFEKGQRVDIYDQDETLRFAGVIETATSTIIAESAKYHRIIAVDWHYLADKRIVALAEEDTQVDLVVAQIVANYLEAEGVLGMVKRWFAYETMTWEELENDLQS